MVQVVAGVPGKPRNEQIIVAMRLGIATSEIEGKDDRQLSQKIQDKVYDGMVQEAMSLTAGSEATIREHFPTVDALGSLLQERTKFNDPDTSRELFIARQWTKNEQSGIARPFTPNDVFTLRGTIPQDGFSYGKHTANRFRHMLRTEPYVLAFGGVSGHEAGNMIEGGSKGKGRLKAQYVGGYYTAADKNTDGRPCPDILIDASTSVPRNVNELRNSFTQFDKNDHAEGNHTINWAVPIIADGDTGYGVEKHVGFHMLRLGEAGVAGVHFEDQLSEEKVCGHLRVGNKVLIPVNLFIDKLGAAQEQIDIMDTDTVLIGRTDAEGAGYITYNDLNSIDRNFIDNTRERHRKGYYPIKGGLDLAIARAIAFAPYVDMIWFESTYPDLEQAKEFARAIQAVYPDKPLAYNLSPSFNWNGYFTKKILAEMKMTEQEYASANKTTHDLVEATVKYQVCNFTEELGKAGYKFQFGTYEALRRRNFDIFRLSYEFSNNGMAAWIDHEREENEAVQHLGYRWHRTNERTGATYWDKFAAAATSGDTSGSCMNTACETVQFAGAQVTIKT